MRQRRQAQESHLQNGNMAGAACWNHHFNRALWVWLFFGVSSLVSCTASLLSKRTFYVILFLFEAKCNTYGGRPDGLMEGRGAHGLLCDFAHALYVSQWKMFTTTCL